MRLLTLPNGRINCKHDLLVGVLSLPYRYGDGETDNISLIVKLKKEKEGTKGGGRGGGGGGERKHRKEKKETERKKRIN